MDSIVLIMVILLNSALFVVSGAYGKKENADTSLFTIFSAIATLIFFACYNRFTFVYDRTTTIFAVIKAILYIVAMYANILAMKCGSVALTSMIASFSLLLPTAFGILYWKEPIRPCFPFGMVLFCASIILSNLEKRNAPEGTNSKKLVNPQWLLYASLLFFSNGLSSILSTYHQKTGGDQFRGEVMVISKVIVIVAITIFAVIRLRGGIRKRMKHAAIFGMGYGLLNSGISLGVMILATNGVIPQSVFYPVISVGVLVLLFVISRLIFKERFSKAQYVGVLLGAASILLLQI